MLKNLRGVTFATFVTAVGVVCFQPLVGGFGNVVQLLILVTLGATTYVTSLSVLRETAFKEAVRLILSKPKAAEVIAAAQGVE